MKKNKKYRLNKTQFAAFCFVLVIIIVLTIVLVSIVKTMYVSPEKVFTTHPNFVGW